MPREAFQHELEQLQDGVLEMGAMVDRQIERAMESLVERDVILAQSVIRDDQEVNRTRFHIDNICLSLLAQQAPMATDLRHIVSSLAIVTDLERMGDHAEGIANIVVSMQDEPLVKPLIDLPEMARLAREMLRGSLDALVARDVEAAFEIGRADDRVDDLQDLVYSDLIKVMLNDPDTVEACTRLLWVSHNLERIADRATNIAERVVFLVTGVVPQMDVSSY